MKNILLLFLISASFVTFAQSNQNIELNKVESGSFSVYKTVKKGYEKYVFELAKKKWPVELFKSNGGYSKILIKRVGIIDEFYTPDLPAHPAYFFNKASGVNVTVIDKKIYYYLWTSSKGAEITYILSNSKPGSHETEKETLDKYRRSIKSKQTGARDERKEATAALIAKEEALNSLKGKTIKSIRLKMTENVLEIGMLSVIAIGIEVTLTNGTVLKTKNLGGKTPYTDFKVNTKGGDYSGGDFKVADDSRKIPNHKIEIEVSSKFNTTVKGKFSKPLNYKNDLFYNYNGHGGQFGMSGTYGRSINGGHGGDGADVNIRTEKLTINGHPVTKIIVSNASTGRIASEAIIHVNNAINLDVSGGKGGDGDDGPSSGDRGGDGGDGGNGGDVRVTGNGAYQLKINLTNHGGNGGSGGDGNNRYNGDGSNGSRGSSGSLIK